MDLKYTHFKNISVEICETKAEMAKSQFAKRYRRDKKANSVKICTLCGMAKSQTLYDATMDKNQQRIAPSSTFITNEMEESDKATTDSQTVCVYTC